MEINLLSKYPRTKRDLQSRSEEKTDDVRAIARQFGKEFFDGDRKYGYGGFTYHQRFWSEVVMDMIDYYDLTKDSKILDIGCGKGFMLYDLSRHLTKDNLFGIDISSYAIENSMEEVADCVSVGDARDLSGYKDKEFDLVISINTVHNLDKEHCGEALAEINRIGRHSFITVDAWTNDEEKEAMFAWNLTAKTMMHVEDWKAFFEEVGYTGDYNWFMP